MVMQDKRSFFIYDVDHFTTSSTWSYHAVCWQLSPLLPSSCSRAAPRDLDSVRCYYHMSLKILMSPRFSPRDAMRKRGLCCRPVSARLSVRHGAALYPHGWWYRWTSHSAGYPRHSSFWPPAPIPYSKWTLSAGAQNTQGGNILRFSTEIAVYIGIGTE